VSEPERRAFLTAEWRFRRRGGGHLLLRGHVIDDPGEEHAAQENHRPAGQEPGRAGPGHEVAGADRSKPGAETGADADDGEQPLALFRRIEIGGERPELRDHHQIEDADPQEIGDPDVESAAQRQQEDSDVEHEEGRHPLHQLDAIDP